ncbi:MAG TPA: hypothetical protein VNJ02_15315 [Vicinamibacterales bacterium]|nr:hypothetical protein [Vicinamibacterales bacterium]
MIKAIVLVLLYAAALAAIGAWAYRDNSLTHLAWALLLVVPAWSTWRYRTQERLWRLGIFVPVTIPPILVLVVTGIAGRWRF